MNNKLLTEKVFVDHPSVPGNRIYKTGDRASWLPDGTIVFRGRKDSQVKLRGYRIETGEIEQQVLKYSDKILQAVVMIKSFKGELSLVAYYKSEIDIDQQDLRKFLNNHLPHYMVPGFYQKLQQIPLTPNGKIDKKLFPEISEKDRITNLFIAPKTDLEKAVAKIWKEILEVEKVGLTDNFFELGGHSLKVGQFINQLKLKLGYELKIMDVFTAPTIQDIIPKLKKSDFLPIPKVKQSESYPLTASQKRLWVLSQFKDGNLAYNMTSAFELKGNLNVEKLNQAFRHVINEFEILRTYFKETSSGEVRQYIVSKESNNFAISVIEKGKKSIKAYLKEEYQKAFDLREPNLVRATLIKSSTKKYTLISSLHHIISDGWSMNLLTKKVISKYNSLVNEVPLLSEEISCQYKDYAVWNNNRTDIKVEEDYWINQLSGELPVLNLPFSKPRPALKTYNGESINHVFSNKLTTNLNDLAQQENATLFMVLMAMVNGIIYRYTNDTDTVLGTPIAGRNHPELENQIGLFLNTLAIRTKFDGDFNIKKLIASQKTTLTDAYSNQNYPFDFLIDKLELARDTSRSALFDVMIVLQNQGQLEIGEHIKMEGLEIKPIDSVKRNYTQFDLTFNFSEIKDELHLEVEYNCDIYRQEDIKQLLGHLEHFIAAAIDNPKEAINQIPILAASETDELLNNFNQTKSVFSDRKNIVDLFEEQVKKTPKNIAISFQNKTLNYKQLDTESNQLANYLLKHYSIKIEDLIIVKLERSDELVITLLAILKTGAAYVPIDPSYPKHRIDYIEEDSKSKVVIDAEFLKAYGDSKNFVNRQPKVKLASNNLAYVVYTSGSTGKPKGVMVEHKSLANLCNWHVREYQVTEKSRQTLFASPAFDASVWEIFPYLLSGAALYQILEDSIRYDATQLVGFLKDNNITHTFLPPQIIEEIILTKNKLSKIKFLTGGDVLKLSNKTELNLYNNYGPTENTVVTTSCSIKNKEITTIPIGKPIDNTQVFILSDKFELQPKNVIGELCI